MAHANVRILAMNTSTASSIMSSSTPATKATKKVTKKTEEAAAPVAAPVAAAPAAAAPAAAKKAAAAPKKVSVAAPVAAAVATPNVAVAAATAVTAAPVESAEAPVVSVQDDVKAMLTQANTVRETVGSLVAELKRLEKRVARLQKEADKRRRRSKKPVEGEEVKPRKPSIFELPTPLSNELCGFLGRPNGSLESRSNVTKAITTYVKAHELKDKHTIKPDAKLKALLGVKAEEVLTYFNLQRYLNRHYLKTEKPAATA